MTGFARVCSIRGMAVCLARDYAPEPPPPPPRRSEASASSGGRGDMDRLRFLPLGLAVGDCELHTPPHKEPFCLIVESPDKSASGLLEVSFPGIIVACFFFPP